MRAEIKIDGKAGYGRPLEAWVENGKCDACLRTVVCLVTDSSEGEYSGVSLCKDCILSAFERAAE